MCRALSILAVIGIPAIVMSHTVSSAEAGVVLVSRTSTLAFSRDASAGTVDESRSFNEFGRFDDQLLGDMLPDGRPNGQAAQDTTFEAAPGDGLAGFGRMAASAVLDDEPDGTVNSFTSGFAVTFDVVGSPAPYTLTGEFFNSHPRTDTSRIILVTGESGDVIFQVSNGGFPDSTENNPSFAEAGELAPGRYTLLGDTIATSFDPGTGDEHLASADFAFAVIPLPPGVWTGAAGLIAALGASRFSLWRRRSA
jgi:hypothetical protein